MPNTLSSWETLDIRDVLELWEGTVYLMKIVTEITALQFLFRLNSAVFNFTVIFQFFLI